MKRITRPSTNIALASVAACALGASACKPQPTQATTPARRELPPPTRPANLLVSGHFGHPASSVRALSALASQHVPFELGMSLVLGFDSTVLAAVDLSKPVDMAVTGTPEERDITVSFFPAAPASLRSTLSTRFRLTTVEGVGERLDARAQGGRDPAWRCAIVGAPGAVSSRVVCSSRDASLAQAARWLALESSRRESESDDALFEVDGTTARASLVPYLRRNVEQLSAVLGASARQARDEHTRAPDIGDPEPLVEQARQASAQVDTMFADLRRLVIKLTVESNALVVDATGELDAEGQSTLSRGTARAMAMPTTHPLTGRLPADAPLAAGWRNPADSLRGHMQALAQMAFRVMGSRVPSPELAQSDLEALFAHVGDEVAISFARGPAPARSARPAQRPRPNSAAQGRPETSNEAEPALGPWEFTALVSQDDNGAAATAALPRIARSEWLRGMRIGTVAPTITSTRTQLVVRLPPPQPVEPNEQGIPRAAPGASGEASVAVSQGQLALLWSANARDHLRRLDARTAGPSPTVLASASEAPFVLGADARGWRGETPSAPVRLSWGASRQGPVLSSRFHLTLSDQVLRMLRRARREE